MTSHRLSQYAGVTLAGAAVVLLAVWVFCGSIAAQAPNPGLDGAPPELYNPPVMDMPPEWDSPRREKRVTEFERRLGRLKPFGKNKKKDANDYYLVATGDVNPAAKTADIRFMVLQGVRKTAEFLVDYIAAAPQGVLRKWHVFGRFKEEKVANEALATARLQYDRMVAYRQQLQRIYAVRSTRRC